MAEINKKAAYDPWEDKVPVMLFEDGDQYTGDVFVAVNGRTFQIQRGVEVLVPRCVKEVLDNANRTQKETTARLQKLINTDGGMHKYGQM